MNIYHNVTQIKQQIADAEIQYHRTPGSVLLLAVSKKQSAQAISTAFQCGIEHFGENYYQEALTKMTQLSHLPIYWHFIGPIQSNKTKGIASHFTWVHSINRLKIAQLLNQYRPEHLPLLNVCLQVNLIDEKSKAGVSPQDVYELALAVSQLPQLKLRGLMTIPPPEQDEQKQYQLLLQLNHLLQVMNQQLNLNMDTLSMGMSDDFIAAIKAGSTIVRVGRALFGERTK